METLISLLIISVLGKVCYKAVKAARSSHMRAQADPVFNEACWRDHEIQWLQQEFANHMSAVECNGTETGIRAATQAVTCHMRLECLMYGHEIDHEEIRAYTQDVIRFWMACWRNSDLSRTELLEKMMPQRTRSGWIFWVPPITTRGTHEIVH